MSDSTKEKFVKEDHHSFKPVYDFHFYARLHLCWLLAVIAIFLGQAWWLIPLPGDLLLPPYRTYPATVLKSFFEGLAVILAARSLVVALIKVFTEGIYPHSVIQFHATGGMEAIYSGIRYRSGFRYLIIASLLPIAGLLGNLLQAEFQSSTTVFYHLQDSSNNQMEAVQCQHIAQNQYSLASAAFSKGLITNTLADASSILNNFNQSTFSSFGISLISTDLAPISNISIQTPNQNTIVKRNDCGDDKSGSADVGSTQANNTTVVSSSNVQHGAVSNNSDELTSLSESQLTTSLTNMPSSTLDTVTAHATPTSTASNSSNLTSSTLNYTATVLFIDGEQVTDIRNQIEHFQTFSPITLNNTALNGTNAVNLYILRHSSEKGKEAIVILSSPPEYTYKAGVYVSAQSTNYTCFSGNTSPQCSETSAITSSADNKVVADAVAEAMRSNVGLYGTAGMITDILDENYQNDSKLVDALFTNPLCSDLSTYPITGKSMYPYTRATWSILAILWSALLAIVYGIGAYLIGYTIDVFCHLTQYGNLLPQIINNSTLFVNAQSGEPIEEKMYLNWEKVELFTDKDQSLYDDEHNHGFTVTTEEL
ncbi:hypothetical protein G6F37_004133 [Rhizopus arrhizus]|nr:hypothetical protein G6F38_005645 [Rhizopus arrhizus]KAG1160286.1 hypothetical protein G6F37_004133 [Rhizopus arrhizus]